MEFDKFIELISASYKDVGEDNKIAPLVAAAEKLKSYQVVSKDANYIVFSNREFNFIVNYPDNQSLLIERIDDRRIKMSGYIRDLDAMMADLISRKVDEKVKSELYCDDCEKLHVKYGVEIEFMAGNQDSSYRTVLLRAMNDKTTLNYATDAYGEDGSRRPLEFRNINGNTAEEIRDGVQKAFNKYNEVVATLSPIMPNFGFKKISVRECGTHIHVYNKTHPAWKVSHVHTAVAMVINSMEEDTWISRISQGYGKPFDMRCPGPWCESERSLELRVLNSVHPESIYIAIKSMEDILKANASTMKEINLSTMYGNRSGFSSAQQYADKLEELMSVMIKNKVITLMQIYRITKYLEKNYKPLKEIVCVK